MPDRGSVWYEPSTNRFIVVTHPNGPRGPWYRYADETASSHCDAEDFFLWDQFLRVSPEPLAEEPPP